MQRLEEYIIEDDGLIPPSYLDEALMSAFTATSSNLVLMARNLMTFERPFGMPRGRRGVCRAPTCIPGHPSAVLDRHGRGALRQAGGGGDNPAFEAYCLDPSIAARPLLDCYATVHMSGTLVPLNEYRDSLGLPTDGRMCIFPSPFPPENRKVLYLEDVTTKYEEMIRDEDMVARMEDHAVARCATSWTAIPWCSSHRIS